VGRTGARIKKLEKSDSYADQLLADQIKINGITREALTDIEGRLRASEELNVMLKQDIVNLKVEYMTLARALQTQNNVMDLQVAVNSSTRERLEDIENILSAEVSKAQLANTKQEIHDANIRSISNNLDEATFMISQLFEKLDKLQNTAWRRFFRWVRLLFTV